MSDLREILPTMTPPERAERFLVGYARVSMSDQNCQRQIEELEKVGCKDIFVDHASGRNMDRPGWAALWRDIRAGDTVVLLTLDRLGRDVLQILQTIEAMKVRGVELKVLIGGMDTSTPSGRLAFNISAAFAQFERELIVERTAHGLQKARERGVVGGRPQKITAEVLQGVLARQAAGEAVRPIAESLGVSYGGLKKALDRHHNLNRRKGNEHG
jgi:DNA invertase Pin-like site-specific DNA recombinase